MFPWSRLPADAARGPRRLDVSRLYPTLLLGGVVAFFAATLLAPLVSVFVRSLGSPAFAPYLNLLSHPVYRTVLLRTVWMAALVTAACVFLSYPAAYAMITIPARRRTWLLALILISYLTSYIIRAYAWIAIVGVDGPLVWFLHLIGVHVYSLVGTFAGVVIAMIPQLLPLMLLPVFAAMLAVDRGQMTAAMTLGATSSQAFVRVFVPQTLNGVLTGVTLVFTSSLGFFVVPSLVGGSTTTTVAQFIYWTITKVFDWKTSGSMAIVLLALVLLIFAAAGRIVSVNRLFGLPSSQTRQITERPRRTRPTSTSVVFRAVRHIPGQAHGRLVAFAALILCLVILNGPLLLILGISFQPHRLLSLPVDGLSLRWWQAVAGTREWFQAGWLSLKLAVVAAIGGLLIGYVAAWLTWNTRSRWVRTLLTGLCVAPLIVPLIVLAIGIYAVFLRVNLVGSFLAVAVSHAMLSVPYTFTNVLSGFSGYDHKLDLAASTLGAKPLRTLLRVRVPLLRPALQNAAVFAFLVSFDELVLTLFLGGIGFTTLPLRMWAGANQDLSPELAVIGAILVTLTLVLWSMVSGRARTVGTGPMR